MDDSPNKPLLLTYENRLHDVASFAKKHPGGEKILRALSGTDVDQYMSGQERVLGLKHEHSKAAYDILSRYAVDHRLEEDVLVNGTTPLFGKVGNLKERYWSWIHQPYEGSLRLFASDFLESLTRTKWYAVPLIWMPLVLYFAFNGLAILTQDFGASCYNIYYRTGTFWGAIWAAALFAIGSLTWTLVEYGLHRGVFHWRPDPTSYKQITLHFLMHGLHHKTPMDSDRLVFPPAPALLIIGFFYVIYRALLVYPVFCCFASGKLFGYICYDVTHYYLHHGAPKPQSNMHFRKVYHHNHHFKDYDLGFGISTVLWDYVFGTVGSGPL